MDKQTELIFKLINSFFSGEIENYSPKNIHVLENLIIKKYPALNNNRVKRYIKNFLIENNLTRTIFENYNEFFEYANDYYNQLTDKMIDRLKSDQDYCSAFFQKITDKINESGKEINKNVAKYGFLFLYFEKRLF